MWHWVFLGAIKAWPIENLQECAQNPVIGSSNFAFCQCKQKQGSATKPHVGKRGLHHQRTSKKSPVRRKSCSFEKSFLFSFRWGNLKEELFFLLMILPCEKFCQVTSLGVVPRSRKVLLQLFVGTSNGFLTNPHDW